MSKTGQVRVLQEQEHLHSRIESAIQHGLDGKALEALAQLDHLLSLAPAASEAASYAHFARGNLLVSMGRHHEGLAALRQAASLNASHPSILFNLGLHEVMMGDRAGGRGTLLRALGAGHPRASLAIECLNSGTPFTAGTQGETPEDMVMRHIQRGLESMAHARPKDALVDYNRAIELAPSLGHAYTLRGAARAQLHQLDQAVADHDRAIALDRLNPEAFYNRGTIKNQLSRWGSAIKDFTTALQLRPGDGQCHNNRGNALMQLSRLDAAMEDLTAAVNLEPRNSLFHLNKAICHLKRGEIPQFAHHAMTAHDLGDPRALELLHKIMGAK